MVEQCSPHSPPFTPLAMAFFLLDLHSVESTSSKAYRVTQLLLDHGASPNALCEGGPATAFELVTVIIKGSEEKNENVSAVAAAKPILELLRNAGGHADQHRMDVLRSAGHGSK